MAKLQITAAQRKNWEMAIAHLRTVPPERFEFKNWIGADWGGAQDLSCGTTACALGWLVTSDYFRALGLVAQRDEFGDGFVCLPSYAGLPGYTGTSVFAARLLFGSESPFVAGNLWEWLHETPGADIAWLGWDATLDQVVARMEAILEYGVEVIS